MALITSGCVCPSDKALAFIEEDEFDQAEEAYKAAIGKDEEAEKAKAAEDAAAAEAAAEEEDAAAAAEETPEHLRDVKMSKLGDDTAAAEVRAVTAHTLSAAFPLFPQLAYRQMSWQAEAERISIGKPTPKKMVLGKAAKVELLDDLADFSHAGRLAEMVAVFWLEGFENLREQDGDFKYEFRKEELPKPLMMYKDLDDVSPRAGWLHCFGGHSNRNMLIHPARGRSR